MHAGREQERKGEKEIYISSILKSSHGVSQTEIAGILTKRICVSKEVKQCSFRLKIGAKLSPVQAQSALFCV